MLEWDPAVSNVTRQTARVRFQNVRRFLFHTTLASGAAGGFPPLVVEAKRGTASRAPLPVFATRRGRDTDRVADPVGGVLEPGVCLSVGFDEAVLAAAFDARNVLLTETDLKVAGFLAEEPVRP